MTGFRFGAACAALGGLVAGPPLFVLAEFGDNSTGRGLAAGLVVVGILTDAWGQGERLFRFAFPEWS
jgi:hypothetical protein